MARIPAPRRPRDAVTERACYQATVWVKATPEIDGHLRLLVVAATRARAADGAV